MQNTSLVIIPLLLLQIADYRWSREI